MAFIIDLGSSFIKCGFSENKEIYEIYPSVVGHPFVTDITLRVNNNPRVHNEALKERGVLHLINPIRGGLVIDWIEFKRLIESIIPKECPDNLLLLKSHSSNQDEKLLKFFFENFNFKKISIQSSTLMAGYYYPQPCTIIDLGDGKTQILSIKENDEIFFSELGFGGWELTEYTRLAIGTDNTDVALTSLLLHPNGMLQTTAEFDLSREIKEKICRIEGEGDIEVNLPDERIVECPIDIGSIYFKPEKIGKSKSLLTELSKIESKKLPVFLIGGGSKIPDILHVLSKNFSDLEINLGEPIISQYYGAQIFTTTELFQVTLIERD